MRFFKILAWVFSIIFLLSLLLLHLLAPAGVQIQRVRFQGARGKLVGDLYLPAYREGRVASVLLCHGVEVNKEVMGHLGVEFARRGMVALAFDYGGYGESDRHNDELELMVGDSIAALNYLVHRPETKGAGAVALVGHSMGVTYSVEMASRVPMVAGVVGLGNEAIASSIPPRNVALAIGIYDAFHTLADMKETVAESAGRKEVEPNRVYGRFADGSARALITSPYSDHGIEPLDPLLMRKTLEWAQNSIAGLSLPALDIREPYRAELRFVAFASGCMALIGLLVILALPASVKTSGSGLNVHLRLRAHFFIVAAAAIVGNMSSPGVALACTDFSLAALIAGSVAAALTRMGGALPDIRDAFAMARKKFISGLGIAIILACLFFGLLMGGFGSAYSLGYLRYIPVFFFYIILLRPYEGLCMLRAYGFHKYSEAWIPGLLLSIVICMELARPGVMVEIISRIIRALVKAFQIKGPFKLSTSRWGLVGAAAAFAGLVYILDRRFEEGWLSGDAVHRMLLISFKFMIIPLALLILIVNIMSRRKK